jgi:serine/threonine-protein kinase
LTLISDASSSGLLLELGQLIAGRYRLERPLMRYGSGTIFKAHDVMLREAVALKIVSGASLDEPAVRSLCLEARLARRVNHPNALRIYGIGVHRESGHGGGGLYFISMKLVHGVRLSRLLKGGLLEFASVTSIAQQILGALVAAHACSVVHGALTTGSVIVQGPIRAPVCITSGFGQLEAWHAQTSPTQAIPPSPPAALSPESDLLAFARVVLDLLEAYRLASEEEVAKLTDIAARCSSPSRDDRFLSAAQVMAEL